jgi:methylmalonyl-CoA mutase C-terminal domain/subunit
VGTLRSIPGVRRRYRVVVAKPGLDGHDRGAKVIARALRDSGFEVVYTGLHQTPDQIAATVVQEDADAVGLSVLSGAHMTLFPRVIEAIRQRTSAVGGEDVLVFGGGIIPPADVARLKEMGVAEIFGPGATMASICEWLESALDTRDEQEARGPV